MWPRVVRLFWCCSEQLNTLSEIPSLDRMIIKYHNRFCHPNLHPLLTEINEVGREKYQVSRKSDSLFAAKSPNKHEPCGNIPGPQRRVSIFRRPVLCTYIPRSAGCTVIQPMGPACLLKILNPSAPYLKLGRPPNAARLAEVKHQKCRTPIL
jgi:hypothetical protein